MDTIKKLEQFEKTEFGDEGHISDHSEYQESSSVDDELDLERHSILDNDGN